MADGAHRRVEHSGESEVFRQVRTRTFEDAALKVHQYDVPPHLSKALRNSRAHYACSDDPYVYKLHRNIQLRSTSSRVWHWRPDGIFRSVLTPRHRYRAILCMEKPFRH